MDPAPFVAVLDACVLIPAALRDTLLRAAAAGLYQARWSDEILEEVRRNLIADIGLSVDQAQRLIGAMNHAFPDARVSGYEGIVSGMPNHPKDRHVAAAAMVGHAHLIVTANLRDFPNPVLAPFGIEAQSPDEFLTNLLQLNPDTVAEIIRHQTAGSRAHEPADAPLAAAGDAGEARAAVRRAASSRPHHVTGNATFLAAPPLRGPSRRIAHPARRRSSRLAPL